MLGEQLRPCGVLSRPSSSHRQRRATAATKQTWHGAPCTGKKNAEGEGSAKYASFSHSLGLPFPFGPSAPTRGTHTLSLLYCTPYALPSNVCLTRCCASRRNQHLRYIPSRRPFSVRRVSTAWLVHFVLPSNAAVPYSTTQHSAVVVVSRSSDRLSPLPMYSFNAVLYDMIRKRCSCAGRKSFRSSFSITECFPSPLSSGEAQSSPVQSVDTIRDPLKAGEAGEEEEQTRSLSKTDIRTCFRCEQVSSRPGKTSDVLEAQGIQLRPCSLPARSAFSAASSSKS